MRIAIAVGIAAVVVTGAVVAPSVRAAVGAVGAERGIAAATQGMRAALQRKDAKALASFYTEDADLAGPVALRGRAAIERHMAQTVALGIVDVKLEQQETFPGAEYTAQTGRAAFFDGAGARVTVLSYMTLWKKEGEAWRIHRDVSIPIAVDAAAVAAAVARMGAQGGFAVKESASFHAVVLPMTGSYAQHGEAIGRLAVWLESAGVKPAGPPFGRYMNSAEDVPEEQLQWEVGFPVAEGTQAAAPFEVREIFDGDVASASIGGQRDGAQRPWAQLVAWAEKQGYHITGPAMEIWAGESQTEMRIAVRK